MACGKPDTREVLKGAIANSALTYAGLEGETGVQRASIMRLMRGEQSLRLDMADKLAAYFGIRVLAGSRRRMREKRDRRCA